MATKKSGGTTDVRIGISDSNQELHIEVEGAADLAPITLCPHESEHRPGDVDGRQRHRRIDRIEQKLEAGIDMRRADQVAAARVALGLDAGDAGARLRPARRVADEAQGRDAVGEGRVVVRADEGVVLGDRQQLDQLVRNLIDNALKYGDPTQPVSVDLAVHGSEAELVVTDKGEGIHPDHLPYLTRRFYRTDPGRSRAAGGTGLGLSIVKHVASIHGGDVSVWSSPGVGSTFSFRLPRDMMEINRVQEL